LGTLNQATQHMKSSDQRRKNRKWVNLRKRRDFLFKIEHIQEEDNKTIKWGSKITGICTLLHNPQINKIRGCDQRKKSEIWKAKRTIGWENTIYTNFQT
jgi:hypothetical protein